MNTIEELREWLKEEIIRIENISQEYLPTDFPYHINRSMANGLRIALVKLDELEANQTTVDGCYKHHCIRCGVSRSSMCPHCGDGDEEDEVNT